MRILVVEDEHGIAQSIKKGLEQEHYAVDLAYTGTDGYDLATSENYDVIILDLMLPEMDGVEICRKLRDEKIYTPVLMLTAKSQVNDKVEGLNAGADDYLAKPFAFEELLARIRALSRRPQTQVGTILECDVIKMDTTSLRVTLANKEIILSSKEYALLEYFLRHKNTILSKSQIIDHVWNYEADILPNTVEVYVRKLRTKGIQIITVRGFGYKIGDGNV
jgi:DNA-binding response OmpR family regulator